MLCAEATAGLHLLTYHILEPHLSQDIKLDLSHVFSHLWCYYSTLQLSIIWINASSFPAAQLLKYDDNIVIT